jgi:hypothetical protein
MIEAVIVLAWALVLVAAYAFQRKKVAKRYCKWYATEVTQHDRTKDLARYLQGALERAGEELHRSFDEVVKSLPKDPDHNFLNRSFHRGDQVRVWEPSIKDFATLMSDEACNETAITSLYFDLVEFVWYHAGGRRQCYCAWKRNGWLLVPDELEAR